MLDKLPAWLRHLILVVAAAALVVVSTALSHGGVSTISWSEVGDAAAGAGVGYLILLITPLTRQYGVGARAVRNRTLTAGHRIVG